MRIAFLQGKDQIDKVFAPEHIGQMRQMGEVTLNEERALPSEQSLKRQIQDADIAITSWGCTSLTKDILDCAPRLKAVLHAAGTVKGIVTPELWMRGIRISGGSEPLGKGVAETALGMTIASLKDMWRLSAATRQGEWGGVSAVRELYGIKIGVVGAGKAGGHYIRLLQAFDVEVLVHDPLLSDEAAASMGALKVELEQLLALSDVISIHAPLLPETVGMFNRERFALMKDHCIVINTARGALIDEAAFAEELAKGRLFACLDVTDPEPPLHDHPFRSLPNVVLTPHIAGAVNNGLHRLAQYIVEDVKLFMSGRTMQGEVWEHQMGLMA